MLNERDRIERATWLRITVERARKVVAGPQLIADGIVFRGGDATLPRSVPAQAHLQLAVGKPATGRGAIAGGLIVGVGGFVLGAVLANLSCFDAQRPCSPPHVEAGLLLGLLGFGAGAAVGSIVGSQFIQWNTVYDSHPPIRIRRMSPDP
jgi:hypothetical protein